LPSDTPIYLVGSVIFALLENTELEPKKDIDVLSDTPCSNDLVITSGFTPSMYLGGKLYQRRIAACPVDLFVSGNVKRDAPLFFLLNDVINRDFTISALYCTSSGDVLDPSGRGIDDFRGRKLDTIEPATMSLQKDPTRVIRALKWIARGFVPTPTLAKALRAWASCILLDSAKPHMDRMWLKMKKEDGVEAVAAEYGLLEKLNTISDECIVSKRGSQGGFFCRSLNYAVVEAATCGQNGSFNNWR
jgi:hypothetical protein